MLGCISPGVDFVLGDHSTSPLSNRIQAFHSSSHGVVLILSSVHFFRVQSAVLHLLRAQHRARPLSIGALGLGLRGEGAVRSAPAKLEAQVDLDAVGTWGEESPRCSGACDCTSAGAGSQACRWHRQSHHRPEASAAVLARQCSAPAPLRALASSGACPAAA